MIKMMITVVTVFMLSWLPLNTYILLSDLDPGVNNYEHIRYVYFIIHWLAMSHASYNPLIYCWMNAKFRDSFCQLFRRSKLCWPSRLKAPRCWLGALSRLRHQRPLRKESAAEVAALRRCNTYTTYVSVRAVPGSSYRFTKDAAQTNGKPQALRWTPGFNQIALQGSERATAKPILPVFGQCLYGPAAMFFVFRLTSAAMVGEERNVRPNLKQGEKLRCFGKHCGNCWLGDVQGSVC
ncbi:hypothetical protein MRX96_025929 [Rhipicephalus microplus]